jgi:hypothetical protein
MQVCNLMWHFSCQFLCNIVTLLGPRPFRKKFHGPHFEKHFLDEYVLRNRKYFKGLPYNETHEAELQNLQYYLLA